MSQKSNQAYLIRVPGSQWSVRPAFSSEGLAGERSAFKLTWFPSDYQSEAAHNMVSYFFKTSEGKCMYLSKRDVTTVCNRRGDIPSPFPYSLVRKKAQLPHILKKRDYTKA